MDKTWIEAASYSRKAVSIATVVLNTLHFMVPVPVLHKTEENNVENHERPLFEPD